MRLRPLTTIQGQLTYQARAFSSRRTLPRGSAQVVYGQRLHGARGRIAAPAVAHRNQAARAEASACLTRLLLDFRSGGARPARHAILGLDDLDISAGSQIANRPEQQRPANQGETDDHEQATFRFQLTQLLPAPIFARAWRSPPTVKGKAGCAGTQMAASSGWWLREYPGGGAPAVPAIQQRDRRNQRDSGKRRVEQQQDRKQHEEENCHRSLPGRQRRRRPGDVLLLPVGVAGARHVSIVLTATAASAVRSISAAHRCGCPGTADTCPASTASPDRRGTRSSCTEPERS